MSSFLARAHIWRTVLRTRPVVARRGVQTACQLRSADKVTHTGQSWEENDVRNIRFVGKEKQVNEQFAINLLAEEPIQVINGNHVWCDGGDAALGHPKVYINLDKPEVHDCGYCGNKFLSARYADQVKGKKTETPTQH